MLYNNEKTKILLLATVFTEFSLKVVCGNLFSRFFTLFIKTTYFYKLKYFSYVTVKVLCGSCWTLRKSFELIIFVFCNLDLCSNCSIWMFLIGLCIASLPNSPGGGVLLFFKKNFFVLNVIYPVHRITSCCEEAQELSNPSFCPKKVSYEIRPGCSKLYPVGVWKPSGVETDKARLFKKVSL